MICTCDEIFYTCQNVRYEADHVNHNQKLNSIIISKIESYQEIVMTIGSGLMIWDMFILQLN